MSIDFFPKIIAGQCQVAQHMASLSFQVYDLRQFKQISLASFAWLHAQGNLNLTTAKSTGR